MSLRTLLPLVAALVLGCGGAADKTSDEPTTAKEKQRREARAPGDDKPRGSKSWGGWRYKGDRKACFFQVKGRCFKTENAACQAARCTKPKKCKSTGGGPALVSCK